MQAVDFFLSLYQRLNQQNKMLRQLKSSSRHKTFRGGDVEDGGVEETKTENKKKYVPPPFRTFVLVRREGDVWIPLRQYSAQSPRNVALKAKVPSGSIVSVQDPVDGKVHEYKTLIETIPEIERTQVQRERNISTRKKVYKQGMYSCPPCGEGFRREKKSAPTRRREAVTVEASAQTDDSADDDSASSSSESDLSSLTSAASAADDDMATEIAVENFIQQRRQRQRDRREVKDRIEEAEEAGFFEIDNEPGKKRKRR